MGIIRDGSGVFEVLHSVEKANFVTKVIYGPIIHHTFVFIINILFIYLCLIKAALGKPYLDTDQYQRISIQFGYKQI